MANLSLSWALNRKKRIRIGTAVAILLLLFFGVSIMVSKNPKGTKAATKTFNSISPSLYIGASDFSDDNKDIIIDGVTVTIANHHDFNSLTITNNGRLTHYNLSEQEAKDCDLNNNGSIFDLTDAQSVDCINARYKKVDIAVAGDITLTAGGSINVDGMGYPGGKTLTDCQSNFVLDSSFTNAYGPGKGQLSFNNNVQGGKNIYGSGAGYGGLGGSGLDVNALNLSGGPVYPNLSTAPSTMEFGSGGGAAKYYFRQSNNNNASCRNGGSGGGRVYIKGKNIVIGSTLSGIYANGTNESDFGQSQATNDARGGGGSGGSIWIETEGFSYPNGYAGFIAPSYSGGSGAGLYNVAPYIGGSGAFSDTSGLVPFNISANGGTGGGSGAGGRIIINKIIFQPVTIKKTLLPLERPAGTTNTNFNPYALQKGDKIRVKFEVTNLILGTLTLTDEMLKVQNSNPVAYCNYDSVAGITNGTLLSYATSGNYPLVWTYTVLAGDNGAKSFSYTCVVQ